MTEPTVDITICVAIFEHGMFAAGNTNTGYLPEGIRHVEATCVFSPAELADELGFMAKEGLVLRRDDSGGDIREYWEATRAGQIARELRWQQRKRRHPALASRTAPVSRIDISEAGKPFLRISTQQYDVAVICDSSSLTSATTPGSQLSRRKR